MFIMSASWGVGSGKEEWKMGVNHRFAHYQGNVTIISYIDLSLQLKMHHYI